MSSTDALNSRRPCYTANYAFARTLRPYALCIQEWAGRRQAPQCAHWQALRGRRHTALFGRRHSALFDSCCVAGATVRSSTAAAWQAPHRTASRVAKSSSLPWPWAQHAQLPSNRRPRSSVCPGLWLFSNACAHSGSWDTAMPIAHHWRSTSTSISTSATAIAAALAAGAGYR